MLTHLNKELEFRLNFSYRCVKYANKTDNGFQIPLDNVNLIAGNTYVCVLILIKFTSLITSTTVSDWIYFVLMTAKSL